jgi:hypothetical protein
MRTLALLAALVSVSAWGVVRHLPEREAQADTRPALDPRQVQSIALDGRDLPSSALRAAISTQIGELVDDARLERDRAAIQAELSARGHLAAKVAPASVTHGPRGGAYIVFDVEPGPLFHLRAVTVTGPGRRDAAVVRLAAGDEAIQARVALARQTLADTYLRHGGKRVDLRVTPDAAAAALDVELATK